MSEDFALWTWAVRTYARDGVPSRCLVLQDGHGFHVNVVLACVWAATQGWEPNEADLEELVARTATARRRVEAVRGVRKDTKGVPDAGDFYTKLKVAELAGEKVLQRQLWTWLEEHPRLAEGTVRQRAERSLGCYAEHLSVWPAAESAVQALLDAVLD